MTSLSDVIIARVGLENISRNSALGRIVKRRGVPATGEFRRVQALPRRDWNTPELEELRLLLTEHLRLPGGDMELWPIQAAALREIHDYDGAFLPIGVGRGKALISLLAPVVLEAERPILFVPADLREQTYRKVLPEMERHWRLHDGLRVIGYSELSLAKNNRLLWELKPDLIVLDECHCVKNRNAGRTKRLVRFMKDFPETKVVAMSGTVSNRSVKDYWHTCRWCQKDNLFPMPVKYRELDDWSLVLDEKVDDDKRMAPGALAEFVEGYEPGVTDTDSLTLNEVRRGYRNRLTSTPGIVATGEDVLGTSLRIYARKLRIPQEVYEALNTLLVSWTTPNDDLVAEAVDLWRHARELALGFFYKWKVPGPREWMDARKEWKKFVRDTLKHSSDLDTELQVWRACADGKLATYPWKAWADVKDAFRPETEPCWLDDFAVDDCIRWAQDKRGIVWVEHVAFGERLEAKGLPYYGAGKRASADILDANGGIAASIHAHGRGKNLHQWCDNLVTAPPTSGKTWEQMLGRTHRVGQEADEVTFEVYQYAGGQVESFDQARADARYLENTLGGVQKLNYADLVGMEER